MRDGALRRFLRGEPHHCAWKACVLALLLANTSCSTLSPQIFSPHTAPRREEPVDHGPRQRTSIGIQEAILRTEGLQAQYLNAVRDLSELNTGTSAALIGLSALGLLKGVISPNGRDLAAIGVVGSATYLYGSTMASRPRQELFAAGAKALNCALTASAPFDLPSNWMAGTDDGSPSLQRLADEAVAQRSLLDRQAQELRRVAGNVDQSVTPARAAPADCSGVVLQRCEPKVLDNRQLKLCEARQARCTAQPASVTRRVANPDVDETLARFSALRRSLGVLLGDVGRLKARVEMAGTLLWRQAESIQIAVSRENLKTEPDPSAVLALAQGLRDSAFRFAHLPAPSSATRAAGKAESDGARGAKVQPRPDELLRAADGVYDLASQAADNLSVKLREMSEMIRSVPVRLADCQLVPNGTAPAPPAPVSTQDGDETPAPRAAQDIRMDTTQFATPDFKSQLDLEANATTDEVVRRVANCQQKKLSRAGADGKTLDTMTLTVMVTGQCRGLT